MLQLEVERIPDPGGHNPALLLKGDWIVVTVSNEEHIGRGEASHSGDDAACIRTVRRLFQDHVRDLRLDLSALAALAKGAFARPASFVEATALSALDQALHELLARREGVPVWQLFCAGPARDRVETYATLNRALTARTAEDYEATARRALEQGFRAVKVAPFEAVTRHGAQWEQSRYGLDILRHLRASFPDLSIRVDFHERFRLETFLRLLPELESLRLQWIEAPIPAGANYRALRRASSTPIALGELRFALEGFLDIVEQHWADVIMPDVKHVGGIGPLVRLARAFSGIVAVSPHNPSGPIATLASAHACAAVEGAGPLEIPLLLDPARAYYADWIRDGWMTLPPGAGWGQDSA